MFEIQRTARLISTFPKKESGCRNEPCNLHPWCHEHGFVEEYSHHFVHDIRYTYIFPLFCIYTYLSWGLPSGPTFNTVPKDPPAPHLSELRQLTRSMTHHDSLESAIRKRLGDEKNLPWWFEKSQWETRFFFLGVFLSIYIQSPYIPSRSLT